MTDKNHDRDDLTLRGWEGIRGSENDTLDRELDLALAKYAAVEPRMGLEERILANLQAEQTRVPEQSWGDWGSAAAVAAVIVVAVALAWKSSPVRTQIVQPAPAQQSPQKSPPESSANDQHAGVRNAATPNHPNSVRHSPLAAAAVATANPKLDVFPSAQPLSEQEKLLLTYVQRFPTEAARIARAQTELAAREELERSEPPPAAGAPRNAKNVLE